MSEWPLSHSAKKHRWIRKLTQLPFSFFILCRYPWTLPLSSSRLIRLSNIRHLTNLDTTLYNLTQPLLPRPILKLLENSGDGRLLFPILLSPLPTRNQLPPRQPPHRNHQSPRLTTSSCLQQTHVSHFRRWPLVLSQRIVIVWAFATSVSRVLLGRHFVFDVAAGAVLGVVNAVVRVSVFENSSFLPR